MCLALAINRSAEQIRNKLPKLTSIISNMTVAFCKVPTSVVAFQEKIPTTTVTPQFILARLYTWLKEVKVVVKTPTLLKKLFRHFLTLMMQHFFKLLCMYHASYIQLLFRPTMHNIYFLF
jgi:hypothetical protein